MKTYDRYKPSGIEWIGDIPEHWNTKKLKYLVNLVDEKPESTDLTIAVENIQSKTGKIVDLDKDKTYQGDIYGFKKDDVLFNKLRPYLAKVYYANQNGGCIGELLILRGSEEIEGKFLFYRTLSANFIDVVDGSTAGTKMPRANWDGFINQLPIAYPSIPEQTAITDYLDEQTEQIDKLIANKEKLIELLKEERTAIINQAVTCGINADVKLKPSGIDWLGDIPKHWEVKKLKFLGKCQNGVSEGSDYFGSGYPFVSYGDVYKNAILPSNVEGLANSSINDRKRFSVKKGDIFFTRTSETIEEIGIASTCLKAIENATFSGFLIRFRPDTGVFDLHFAKYYFRSQIQRVFFVKEMNLVTRASLSQELLTRLPALLPNITEQKEIANFLDEKTNEIDSTISKIENEIELIKEYRTALISEVVTGKIKVAQL